MLPSGSEGKSQLGALAAIFALAFGVRLVFQIAVTGMATAPEGDAMQYDAIGWSLARGGPFVVDGLLSHRAPGYPFLLAAVYRVFGHSLPAARVVQAVIGAANCTLLAALGSRLAGRRVGLLAGFGLAVFPYAIYWSGYLASEPLCALLATASTYALVRVRDGTGWASACGASCALAALTRPNLGLLLPLSLLWLLARGRRGLPCATLAMAVFVLTLLPWTLRNYAVHGRIVPVTTVGGVVLWEGNNPHVLADPSLRGRAAHAPDLPEAHQVEGLPEVEVDRRYFRMAVGFMRDHIGEMPGFMSRKFLRIWNPFPKLESRAQRWLATTTSIILILLLAAGLGAAIRDRAAWVVPCTLPILAVTLTGMLYWADARIRAPGDPEALLIAAYGLLSFRPRRPERRAALPPLP